MTGNAIIIIILVPILFQVVRLTINQERGHRELQERLAQIEDALRQKS